MQTFKEQKEKRWKMPEEASFIDTIQNSVQSFKKKANPTLMGSGVSNAAVPAVSSQANKSGKTYDPNANYMQRSMDAAANGNLAGAMYNERMHNIKDGDMGLGWGASGIWNYIDAQGLGGQREAKYNEIENYFDNGFDYDYLNDPVYQSILGQKEKEAEKAYNDGYAQLSTAFDGDIPVNMINKLLTTKSEIVDSADSYIPQLRQMAYDMYMDKGNQLYNQYGLLDAMADEDYNQFLNDRELMAQGIRDAWSNKIDAERYADDVARWNKEYERGIFESDRDYERGIFESDRDFENKNYWNQTYLDNDNYWKQDDATYRDKVFNYEVGQDALDRKEKAAAKKSSGSSKKNTSTVKDIANLALNLYKTGDYTDIDEAMADAKKMYGISK